MREQPYLADPDFYLTDRHCHCDYSIDATGTIEQYCQSALSKGLRRLIITTHYDCIPGSTAKVNFMSHRGTRFPASEEILQHYVDDVRWASEKFDPLGLTVECGLEFGWYPGCDEVVSGLRKKFRFSWILSGLHEIDAISFASRSDHAACFARYSAESFLERYYEQIAMAAESRLFDAIAHLDYFRKYGDSYYGDSLHAASQRSRRDALTVLASTGTGAEINTSGIRRGAGDWFPSRPLVEELLERGVTIASLGSDSHRPEDVGDRFDTAASWLKARKEADSQAVQLVKSES